jgi:hypothetical protein
MPSWWDPGNVTTDELDSGPETGARQHLGLWVALLVFGLSIGAWLLVEARSNGGGPSPSVTPSASLPEGTPSPTVEQRPGIANAELELGEVCPPVTDVEDLLVVQFTLRNPSAADLVIVDVVPDAPLGGLDLLNTRIIPGGCGADVAPLESGRISPGSSVLVTFWFALPSGCPEPVPLRANVFTRVFGVSRSGQLTRVPLYPDLGALELAACP